jgi:sporulation protein YlmC with PRC-barrel domain
VIVPSKESVVIADTEPAIKGVLEHKNVLKGTKIMTTDGRDLGTMVDLYFDEHTGAVEGYEASGGLFADAATGRSFVPAPQTLKIGQDVAFVPPETADMMKEQVGGIQGALQEAGDKVQETAQKTTEKLQEKAETVGQKLQKASQKASEKLDEATTAVGEKTNGAIAAATVDQAKGRRVRRAVRTDQGRLIVPEGQIVTDVVIERVRSHDKEQELLDAVGVERGEAARASASGAMSAASAQLRATAQQAKQGASDLLERAKAKMGEIREESEEAAIKRALGRPVTRVILDRQDNVILNVGELITNQAVERSRQEGVLDILLSSVYDKKPELSTEDLRAPESGEASLDPRD